LRGAPLPQIKSLLAAADDGSGCLVPQLRDLAGWLAAMRADVFGWVVATEPDALLRGDITRVDDPLKERLVEICAPIITSFGIRNSNNSWTRSSEAEQSASSRGGQPSTLRKRAS
jgi:hypothetical protein